MKGKIKTNPAVDRLYKAVENYVKSGGGKLLVIGGVRIEEWPQDNKHVFHIAVKCMGRKPVFGPPQPAPAQEVR